jgi:hypothetical protein
MLLDDNGELNHIKLDPSLINSDNAIIVLDEYNDTCWVWVGRGVNMPTRMHALRMSKSVQKAGYSFGVTTIGRATTHLIEMMEKDEGDPDVASTIARFRDAMGKKWSFDDGVLAYDPAEAAAYDAKPPEIVDTRPAEPSAPSTPAPSEPVEIVAETIDEPEPKPVPTITEPTMTVEKKAAFLLYSAVRHADLVYTERFERDGNKGIKIEAPGIMVVQALMKGNELEIDPPDFGDGEQAAEIKRSYETWLKRI